MHETNFMYSTTKTLTLSITLLVGLYLGLSSILAIPLIDEDKTKTRELSISLKEELTNIKTSFVTRTLELKYDTLTLTRFEELNKLINLFNTGASLLTNLNNKITNQRMILENHIDVLYYDFLNNDFSGLNAKKKLKNKLLQNFKVFAGKAEYELFLNIMSIRTNIMRLYSIVATDSSKDYKTSKDQFKELITMLNKDPIIPDTVATTSSETAFLNFFPLSNSVVKDESQTLAVLLGLIGLGLLGAAIGTFNRFTSETETTRRAVIINSFFSTIIKSFSASVVTYLSIKGGLSIISDNNDTNPNAYFILFVCFVAAVYSEEIWLWAKTKLLPARNDSPATP